MSRKRLLLLPAVIMVVTAPAAFAHRLVANDGSHVDAGSALAIAEPEVSQLVLHRVQTGGEEIWLTFQGVAGESVYLQLGVPVIDELADYRPAVALVGPGLPGAIVPFALPGGDGAATFEAEDSAPAFFSEPFTGTESWIYVEETVTLPADGQYYIVGYHPTRAPGKLWVAFGKKEVFGVADILAYPDTLRQVRAFHEVSGEPLGFIPRLFLMVATVMRLFHFLWS